MDPLWVLANGTCLNSNLSLLSTNLEYIKPKPHPFTKKQKYPKPKIPEYMTKRENNPLIFAFTSKSQANKFVDQSLYKRSLKKQVYNPENNYLDLYYSKLEEYMPTAPQLHVCDLFEKDHETISNFVFQTNSHFFWIEDIDEDESCLRGMILTPMDEVEYSFESQQSIYNSLENNFLNS
jgi:hypothetical protein